LLQVAVVAQQVEMAEHQAVVVAQADTEQEL
jgi:hypothetical protein